MPPVPPTGPDPHAAGSSRRSSWWVVINRPSGRLSNLTGPTLSVTMATAKPANAVAGPYLSKDAAQAFVDKEEQGGSLPNLNPASWLSSIGGGLASGIEGGVITVLKDIWQVIEGPLLVLLGALIGLWVLVIYFKDDIIKIAGMAAKAAV